MEIKNGHYLNLSNKDYHASSAVSRSKLCWLDKSISYYNYKTSDTAEFKETDDMRIGEAVHIMILQPDLASGSIVIAPEVNKKTKLGRESAKFFAESNVGKVILTEQQYEMAKTISTLLYSRIDNELPGFFAHSVNESSIFFDYDGIQYKCRPDSFVNGVVVDIKTTKDAGKRAFQRSCIEYYYFLQAAMTKLGLASVGVEMKQFAFACVEKTEPYVTGMYLIDTDALEWGEKLFLSLHNKLKRLQSDNEIECFDYESSFIGVPGWANYILGDE